MRGAWLGFGALCAVLASGCATPQVDALLRQRPAGLPAYQLIEVPDFDQNDHQCGPAALAMALDAAGDKVTPQDLVGSVFVPAREGSLPPEMLAAARRRSRLVVQLDPRIDAVLAEVAAGTPVTGSIASGEFRSSAMNCRHCSKAVRSQRSFTNGSSASPSVTTTTRS